MLDELNAGVESLLENYVGIRSNDLVLVIYTIDSREAAAFTIAALRARAINTASVWMRPLIDEGFVDRVRQHLPSGLDVDRRLIVLTFERDTMSHTDQLRQLLTIYDSRKVLVFRAISATPELFSTALRSSSDELSARNLTLLRPLMQASKIRVETEGGTNLQVSLCNDRYHWISNHGRARPGAFVILPAGEVATYPEKVDGCLVADFAFNINQLTDCDSRLDCRPVTIFFENSVAIDIYCKDKELEDYLKSSTSLPNGRRVGELGFGTNPNVSEALRHNSHINERRPGVHIGLGQHNQFDDAVSYSCPIHLDLISRGGKLWFGNDNGCINLEDINESEGPHPEGVCEEDVASPDSFILQECCGNLNFQQKQNDM